MPILDELKKQANGKADSANNIAEAIALMNFSEGGVTPEEIAESVSAYLDEHLTNPTNPPVDTSLAISGAAADAKETGDKITQLKEDLSQVLNFVEEKGKAVFDYYISISAVGDTNTLTPSYNNNFCFVSVPCKKGDVFIIKSYVSGTYGYGFLDADNKVLSRANQGEYNTTEIAPADGTFILNNNKAKFVELSILHASYVSSENLSDYVKKIELYAKRIELQSTSASVINKSDGSFYGTSYGKVTDLIDITGYNRIEYFTYVSNASTATVAFYDAELNYISAVSTNSTSGEIRLDDDEYASAKYVRLCCYDYPNKRFSDFKATIYNTSSIDVRLKTIEDEDIFTPKKKNVLVFGDSITDCCSLIVTNGVTTSYSFRNPSNSYTDAGGQTVNYYMWPFIFNKLLHCNEMRNYARTGASYKDAVRTSGEERQNLSYQINLSIADLENAGGAFAVNDFNPDIIIMALGTNDGTPNDTPQSAYAKIVTDSDGIDVDATLTALDRTKFCEAVLWANLMIRKHFVDALYCVVLPLQRMSDDNSIGTLHEYIKEIAQRFGGAIIIDGAYDSGIVKCNNVISGLGATLKDGLHPNEIGQNMMARMIMSSVNSHFVDYANMQ